jgi:hypothetical protein
MRMTNARTETEPMGDVMLERDGSDDAAMDSAGSVSGKADSDVVVDCVCVCVDSGADDNDSKGWMVLWFVLWKEWLVLVCVCVWVWGDWNAALSLGANRSTDARALNFMLFSLLKFWI